MFASLGFSACLQSLISDTASLSSLSISARIRFQVDSFKILKLFYVATDLLMFAPMLVYLWHSKSWQLFSYTSDYLLWRPSVVEVFQQMPLWRLPIDFCRLWCVAATTVAGWSTPRFYPAMTYMVFSSSDLYSPFPVVRFLAAYRMGRHGRTTIICDAWQLTVRSSKYLHLLPCVVICLVFVLWNA